MERCKFILVSHCIYPLFYLSGTQLEELLSSLNQEVNFAFLPLQNGMVHQIKLLFVFYQVYPDLGRFEFGEVVK